MSLTTTSTPSKEVINALIGIGDLMPLVPGKSQKAIKENIEIERN